MGSTLVYGDGVEDIKVTCLGRTSADLTVDVQDFFTDTFSRGRGREGGGACCTRPVVLGAVLLIWLFSLSVALAVVRRQLDRVH